MTNGQSLTKMGLPNGLKQHSHCLLLRRFDSEAGEAGELEARETGDEHPRDHGKEKEERRNACKNSC